VIIDPFHIAHRATNNLDYNTDIALFGIGWAISCGIRDEGHEVSDVYWFSFSHCADLVTAFSKRSLGFFLRNLK